MSDRAKVIRGLEVCISRDPGKNTCYKCPYETTGNDCEIKLSEDAIALLKEQEAVSTIVEPLNDTRYIFCGACKAMLAQNKPKGYKYCPWCGRKVKWDE